MYKIARHNVIDMILATEMTKHFEHLAKFVNVFCAKSATDVDVSALSLRSLPSKPPHFLDLPGGERRLRTNSASRKCHPRQTNDDKVCRRLQPGTTSSAVRGVGSEDSRGVLPTDG